MQAEIITIGDEILIGQIVDTNSAWMAKRLNEAGFEVFQITTVSDSEDHIIDALDLLGLLLGHAQGRQQHGRQDRRYRDHNQ